MKKIALLGSLIVMFSGCTKVQPYVKQYKINTTIAIETHKQTQCKKQSVKVLDAFSKNDLMLEKMYYVHGAYNVASYTQSQWSERPNKAISAAIMRAIEDSQLFKDVSSTASSVKSDLILENNIEEFIQYFSKDNTKSYVKVVIKATLVDRKTKITIASKKFEKQRATQSLDAYGGVVALSQTLSEILEEEVQWLGSECQ